MRTSSTSSETDLHGNSRLSARANGYRAGRRANRLPGAAHWALPRLWQSSHWRSGPRRPVPPRSLEAPCSGSTPNSRACTSQVGPSRCGWPLGGSSSTRTWRSPRRRSAPRIPDRGASVRQLRPKVREPASRLALGSGRSSRSIRMRSTGSNFRSAASSMSFSKKRNSARLLTQFSSSWLSRQPLRPRLQFSLEVRVRHGFQNGFRSPRYVLGTYK